MFVFQIHFEENHSKEDQAFVSSLKELFGKAKKKILNDDEQENNLEQQLGVNKVGGHGIKYYSG